MIVARKTNLFQRALSFSVSDELVHKGWAKEQVSSFKQLVIIWKAHEVRVHLRQNVAPTGCQNVVV